MFSPPKRNDMSEQPSHPSSGANVTVIARGVRVQGDFTSQGDVVIDGVVEGHVTTTAQLKVGPEAKLKADVTANDATIAGTIEGTLIVKRRLELKSTATVLGDVTCETAAIEAGASMQGKVSIGVKTGSAQKPASGGKTE